MLMLLRTSTHICSCASTTPALVFTGVRRSTSACGSTVFLSPSYIAVLVVFVQWVCVVLVRDTDTVRRSWCCRRSSRRTIVLEGAVCTLTLCCRLTFFVWLWTGVVRVRFCSSSEKSLFLASTVRVWCVVIGFRKRQNVFFDLERYPM